MATAFHGSWTVGLAALVSVLAGYTLAALPNLLVDGEAAPVFPTDAGTAEDLLAAAGRALEAVFESGRPNIVLFGSADASNHEDRYRAAR